MFFKKRKKYQMNLKMANETLQKVFAACEQPPNTIPFDKLVLRRKLNTRTYDFLLVLTGLLLLLTFLAPLAVSPVSQLLNSKTRVEHESGVYLISDSVSDHILCLTLSGEGIKYQEAFQETSSGITESPLSYDSQSGTLYFTYYETETNIYIPVENAPTLHLLLSPE